jgi:hypothetical protein
VANQANPVQKDHQVPRVDSSLQTLMRNLSVSQVAKAKLDELVALVEPVHPVSKVPSAQLVSKASNAPRT